MLSIRYGLGWLAVSLLASPARRCSSSFASRVDELGFTPTGFSLGVLHRLPRARLPAALDLALRPAQRAPGPRRARGARGAARCASSSRRRTARPPDDARARARGRPGAQRGAQRRRASCARCASWATTCCVVDDGSTDRTAEEAREAGAAVLGAAAQPRRRRRPALRLPLRARARLRRRRAGRRRRPARPARDRRAARPHARDGRGHGRRLALRRRRARLRGARRAGGSRCACSPARASQRPASDRRTRRPASARSAGRCWRSSPRNYPVEYLGDTVEALIEAGRAGANIVEHPIAMSPREHGQRQRRARSRASGTSRGSCWRSS